MGLRNWLDRQARHFQKGAKLQRWAPLYEMLDTIFYTPGSVALGPPHVRDVLDLKRLMITVVLALVPAMAMAMYNTGYQAHLAIAAGAAPWPDFITRAYEVLGLGYDPNSWLANVVHGAFRFVPVLLVCFAAGGAMEVLFAIVRKHSVNEGFFVTGFLIPLTLPPTIPLWQVALGTAFGVVVGKEIFGGTGMNFLNPALVARAFLFFAYPAQISGEIWTAAVLPDGVSGATALARVSESGDPGPGLTYSDAVLGLTPGSMGETSFLACVLGALVLLATRVASWRTMLGVVAGTFTTAWLTNASGIGENPMLSLPFHWHIVLGGWAFGTVFMATDPVSSAFTLTGQYFYGFGIGVFTILIRAINPAYPEGMMLAILFMNMFAPLIDHWVVRANIKRRQARYGS